MKAHGKNGNHSDQAANRISASRWDKRHADNLTILLGDRPEELLREMQDPAPLTALKSRQASDGRSHADVFDPGRYIQWDAFDPEGSPYRATQIQIALQQLLWQLAPQNTRNTWGNYPAYVPTGENYYSEHFASLENPPPVFDMPVWAKVGEPAILAALLSYGIRILNSYPAQDLRFVAERLLTWPVMAGRGDDSIAEIKNRRDQIGLGAKRLEKSDAMNAVIQQLKEIHSFLLEPGRLISHQAEEDALFAYNAMEPDGLKPWWLDWQRAALDLLRDKPFGKKNRKEWNEVVRLKVLSVLKLPPEIERNPDLTSLGMEKARRDLLEITAQKSSALRRLLARPSLEKQKQRPSLWLDNAEANHWHAQWTHLQGRRGVWIDSLPAREWEKAWGTKFAGRKIEGLGRTVTELLRFAIGRLVNEDRAWGGN